MNRETKTALGENFPDDPSWMLLFALSVVGKLGLAAVVAWAVWMAVCFVLTGGPQP